MADYLEGLTHWSGDRDGSTLHGVHERERAAFLKGCANVDGEAVEQGDVIGIWEREVIGFEVGEYA